MARIHTLALDAAGPPIEEWYIRVTYDWGDLAGRLAQRAPDIADLLRTRRVDFDELAGLVNTTEQSGAVWCHRDIGASNLVWGPDGPRMIDWENAGPLVPHQELGCWLRPLGPLGNSAYLAYRQAGGPAEITDVAYLTTSIAVHLNYLGVQANLLLDDGPPNSTSLPGRRSAARPTTSRASAD